MSRKFSLAFIVVCAAIMGVLCLSQAASADISGISAGTFQLNGNDSAGSTALPPAEPATPSISGSVLTLTQDDYNPTPAPYYGPGQASSAIYTGGVQSVTGFTAQFTYTFSNPTGDPNPANGVTFVVENDPAGTSALGSTGDGLGYGMNGSNYINDSVAVAFNIYSASPSFIVGSALAEDGATPGPFTATTNGTPSTTVNLASGDPITVLLSYSNLTDTLTETLTDGADVYTTSYTGLDIPSIVGGDTAYVGFTGGYGNDASTQTISDFTYTVTVPLPNAAYTGLALLAGLGLFTLAHRRMTQPA